MGVDVSGLAVGVWAFDSSPLPDRRHDPVDLEVHQRGVLSFLGWEKVPTFPTGDVKLDVLHQVGRYGYNAIQVPLADKRHPIPVPVDPLDQQAGGFFPSEAAMHHQPDYDPLPQIDAMEDQTLNFRGLEGVSGIRH